MGGGTLSKRPIALLAGVLAVALVAAGCGGGSSAPLTKAELIKEGNAVCSNGSEQIKTEAAEFLKENHINRREVLGTAQYRELTETVVTPTLQQETEEIRALGAPNGEEKEVNALLDALEQGIKNAEKYPNDIFKRAEALAEANKKANEYGLKECGKG